MSNPPKLPRYRPQKAIILQRILSIPAKDTRLPERCNEEEFDKLYLEHINQVVRDLTGFTYCTGAWKLWRSEVLVWRSYFGWQSEVPFMNLEPPMYRHRPPASTTPQVSTKPTPEVAPQAAAAPKLTIAHTTTSVALQIEEKDKELKKSKQELEEKEEELMQAKQKLLEEKDKELKKVKQELEEKDEELKKVKQELEKSKNAQGAPADRNSAPATKKRKLESLSH